MTTGDHVDENPASFSREKFAGGAVIALTLFVPFGTIAIWRLRAQ